MLKIKASIILGLALVLITAGVGCTTNFSTNKGASVSGENGTATPVASGATVRMGHVQFTLPETWKVKRVVDDTKVELTSDEAEIEISLSTTTAASVTHVTRTYVIPDGKVFRTFLGTYIQLKGSTYSVDNSAMGSDLNNYDIDLIDFERSARWVD